LDFYRYLPPKDPSNSAYKNLTSRFTASDETQQIVYVPIPILYHDTATTSLTASAVSGIPIVMASGITYPGNVLAHEFLHNRNLADTGGLNDTDNKNTTNVMHHREGSGQNFLSYYPVRIYYSWARVDAKASGLESQWDAISPR
jgi:hypothetical protein